MAGDGVICGERLTTFDISEDGERFCLNVADGGGVERGLSLPTDCLIPLIMSLPEMAARALKVRYRDDSMRIVYPVAEMRAEAACVEEVTILTLTTLDGFAVSFGFSPEDLRRLETLLHTARTAKRPHFVKN